MKIKGGIKGSSGDSCMKIRNSNGAAFRWPSICRFVPILCLLIFGAMFPKASVGQFKYEGPEDERIEEMCRRAAKFLETEDLRATGEDRLGQKVLEALTVLEVYKRYEGEVPKDHPKILAAAEDAADMINGASRDPLSRQHSMYAAALSLILLCEVDDEKYAPEIKAVLSYVGERQNENGGWSYENRPFITDVSQTQYACLALFVAKVHKFRINPEVGKRALNALVSFQSNNSWVYHYSAAGTPISNKNTRSLHTSALGSVYLLSDLLQLSSRAKDMRIGAKNGEQTLPPSVTIYEKPIDGQPALVKDRPLVTFDRGKLGGAKSKGNRWLADNFEVTSTDWTYYYLYALERYAYFREQAETSFAEVPNWYDQGVDHLRTLQRPNGAYPNEGLQNTAIATCLATLFLVRSSELLNQPPGSSLADAGLGFPEKGSLKVGKDGRITSQAAVKGVSDMLALLGESDGEDARAILDGMKITAKSIGQGKSRAERLSLLTGMVMDASPIKRLIAIKVLAGEQNMDNVPALLYALGDPDKGIAKQAHDGLRLVSRRIDAFPLGSNPDYPDFQAVKIKWTKWFLAIRPDAQLID